MRSPTGSAPSPNRLSRTTDPSTATLAALLTWDALKNAPRSMFQMRMSGSSTSVPSIWVLQFRLAATTWSRVLTPAARYCAPGTAARMASTSSAVSVGAPPTPMLTPPRRKLPARTLIRFVPALRIWVSISSCAPRPSATIVMTAETPMIMPSMVSPVRSLLRPSALSATRIVASRDNRCTSAGGVRHRRRPGAGRPLARVGLVADDQAVVELYDAVSVACNRVVVGDEDHGNAALGIQSARTGRALPGWSSNRGCRSARPPAGWPGR